MIVLAVLFVLACVAGFSVVLIGSRQRWAVLPPVVLSVLTITSLALTLNIQEAERPQRELRLYFSLADANVLERVQNCIESASRSDCAAELLNPAGRVVAVFSQRAVPDMARSKRKIEIVRSLQGAGDDPEYGLTVEAALGEIGREPVGGNTVYAILTPRARSAATARNTYRKLIYDRPDLRDRIVFLDDESLGIPRDRLIPQLRLDAPSVIGANAGEYVVAITGENRTGGVIELSGLQLIAAGGPIIPHSLRITDDAIELPAAAEAKTTHKIEPARTFAIRGSFRTAAMGSVTTHSIVVRNGYGETLIHLREITRVEKPVLGVLRAGTASENEFVRFGQDSGVDIEQVFINFRDLEDPSKREGLQDRTADNLSHWGLLVVAEPLTADQANGLLEVLKRIPQSQVAPSLLFVGAGTSSTLFSNLTNPAISGWQTFLSPLGISDLSGARKVLIAVDESGSLKYFHNAVRRAVEVLYDEKYGLGARDANLLVAFCGSRERVCDKNEFKAEVGNVFTRDDWEGSTHLVRLLNYAALQGKSILNSDIYTNVSDLVLFWDGRDVGALLNDRGDQCLNSAALKALPAILTRKIKLHIATFGGGLASCNGPVKPYEVLSGFGDNESGQRFRDTIVLSILSRGLEVGIGPGDGLNEIARRRLKALEGISIVNTLFGPTTFPTVTARGAVVPLYVRHPSGFDTPLLALKDPVSFSTSDSARTLNLRIGYLGLDLASEFAAIELDAARKKQADVGRLVYSAVDAMGARLRASAVQWRLDQDLVLAIRDNFLPFVLKDGIAGDVRLLESDGTYAETSQLAYLKWNELGLDRMGVDLSGADLQPGKLYEMNLKFCHFPTAEAQKANICAQTKLTAPVVGAYPVLMNPAGIDAPGARINLPSKVGFPISEGIAKLTFVVMTIAVTIGVFLL